MKHDWYLRLVLSLLLTLLPGPMQIHGWIHRFPLNTKRGPSSGPPVATTVCQPQFLKCANGKQTGRSGQLQPALMEINGLFIRAEFRWHTEAGPSLSFYTSLHLATSRLSPCLSSSLLSLWNMTACPRCTYSEPAGVNRWDNMLRSCYDAVSYIISTISDQGRCIKLWEHFTGCLNTSSPTWKNKRFVSFC